MYEGVTYPEYTLVDLKLKVRRLLQGSYAFLFTQDMSIRDLIRFVRNSNAPEQKVPFCIIDLGDEDLVLACLDGKSFEEVIDRKKKRDSTSEHVHSQKSVDKNQRRELDENYQIMLEIVRNQYRPGQLPFVQSATGETRPPIPPQLSEESAETKEAETGTEPKKTSRNKGQTKLRHQHLRKQNNLPNQILFLLYKTSNHDSTNR